MLYHVCRVRHVLRNTCLVCRLCRVYRVMYYVMAVMPHVC